MRTGSSTAGSDPIGCYAPVWASATLSSTAKPGGASVLVNSIIEDIAPRDLEGVLIDEHAGDHLDQSWDFDVRELNGPPTCDRGPHHTQSEL